AHTPAQGAQGRLRPGTGPAAAGDPADGGVAAAGGAAAPLARDRAAARPAPARRRRAPHPGTAGRLARDPAAAAQRPRGRARGLPRARHHAGDRSRLSGGSVVPPDSVLQQRLARQLRVAHRGVVREAGDDRGGLLEVVRRRVVVGVQVGVVDVAEVVQPVLYELEAREPGAVEGDVVGAAGVARGDHGGADVVERLQPGLEDRHRGQVLLRVDAADPAGTVVEVEVGAELLVRRLALELAAVAAEERRQPGLLGVGRLRVRGEVLGDVVGRADQALLLAAPQRDADGAARLGADRLEDAHGLHHHRDAGAVVGGAGGGVPGIHVRADHHHLVGERATTGDLGDGVVALAVGVGGEAGIRMQAQAHGFALVQRAHHLVVVLGDHRELRHADRLAGLARTAAAGADDAVVAAAQLDRGEHALIGEVGIELLAELDPLQVLLHAPGALGVVAVLGHGECLQVLEAGAVVAVEVGLLAGLVLAQVVHEQDLAAKLAAVLLEVRVLLELERDRLALDHAVGARGPTLGQRV